jgi:hypothetical protein
MDALRSVLALLELDDEADDTAPVQAEEDELPVLTESALGGDFVPLLERSVRDDGTVLLKLIQPGWGASGYYPREVLQRDGPRVFTQGTKGYWNHPTPQEEAARPEGDLNALAMELVSDARYEMGVAGEGLYADAKVFGPYQGAIEELAPHIGVSIRASGRATQGEAEGRKGPIIQGITTAHSVDAVTTPGAGGEIIRMFEAARSRPSSTIPIPQPMEESMNENDVKEMKEAIARAEAENARLRESLIAREAKELVREALGRTTLPQVTQTRLAVRLAANPPLSDGMLDAEALLERVKNEVAEETQYLNSIRDYGSGRIEGMGQSAPPATQTQEQLTKRMAESFVALGLSEASATQAAQQGW